MGTVVVVTLVEVEGVAVVGGGTTNEVELVGSSRAVVSSTPPPQAPMTVAVISATATGHDRRIQLVMLCFLASFLEEIVATYRSGP